MPDVKPEAVADVSPVAEYADFNAFEAAKNTPQEEPKPAPTNEEGTTAEDSGTSDNEQVESRERDEKGQFKPKKSDVPEGVQKRIDKLTAQRREAERRAEEAERRLQEVQGNKKPAETKTADDDPEPTTEQFDTYEKYVKAQARWEARQEIRQTLQQQKAESAKAEVATKQETAKKAWSDSEVAARKAHPDYDDVVQEAAEAIKDGELPALPDATFAAIMETDSKAEILYHLAKNRADLERLTSVTGPRVLIELGKIEAKLAAPVQEKKPKVSSAPKPPEPVGSRGSAAKNLSEISDYNEWEKARNAQIYRR